MQFSHQRNASPGRKRFRSVILTGLASLLVAAANAGTATFDFTTDPASQLTIVGNNDMPWQSAGGNPGGFLAITYPEGSQYTGVVFPDIDQGKVVTAFKFECDLRVGNSTGDRPADGFSISFARGNDPLIESLPDSLASTGNFAGGIPEGGATTGIAISFDTWSGNTLPDGADIEGIIVRVDNKTILRKALPVRHGQCADPNSLQTGPRDAAYWSGGGDPRDPASWAGLCWQPFSVELAPDGKLTVKYKGNTILDQFQTAYFPSLGRLILAGRTGGANEHTHVDNIRLTTQNITDASPPTVPSNVQATPVHARRVRVTWTAATDDSGRVAYEIERDGTLLPGLVTGASFADTVSPNTSYSYKVRAVDPALNRSAFSAAVTVRTPAETLTLTPGVMKWEAYTGIGGTSVDALLNEAKYPDSPDVVRIVGAYEGPGSFGDNYGARLSGFITPLETGNYVFFLSADDNAQLFLSTDENPANKKRIATETAWSNSRQWTASGGNSDLAEKRSDQATQTEWPTGNTITLQAGRRYYTEMIYKEGGGGDFGAVAIKKAADPDPANGSSPATGAIISGMINPDAGPPSILKQPQSANVAQGAKATFTVEAIGTKPLNYQWQRGGVDIPGATSATLTVNNAGASNFGIYTVVVSNEEGSVTSANANLSVTGIPTILFIHSTGGPNDSDRAVMNRLQSQGWQVQPTGATPSQTSDADGKALIMISSTVSSGEVGDKFRNVAVPMINWEAALQDNFDMTDRPGDADNSTRGVVGSQSQLNIVAANHPLAAGLGAGLKAYSNGGDASWGVPGPGATVVATIADDPSRAALYVYEQGANLFDGTKAPAKRIHFPAGDNTFLALNADGLKLFDAAVNYATGGRPQPPPDSRVSATRSGNQVTITWTAGKLQQADAVIGPWTDVPNATSPLNVTPVGTKFYRAAQ